MLIIDHDTPFVEIPFPFCHLNIYNHGKPQSGLWVDSQGRVDLGSVKYWIFRTYKLTLCSVGGIGWACLCLCFYRVPCYHDALCCCCTAPELNEGYTLIQNQSCAWVHSAHHTTGFRRVEQSTWASCLILLSLCRIVAVRITWGCDCCFRFLYTPPHLLFSVHILTEYTSASHWDISQI